MFRIFHHDFVMLLRIPNVNTAAAVKPEIFSN